MDNPKISLSVSCKAPVGVGGLGQILARVLELSDSKNIDYRYFCTTPRIGDTKGLAVIPWLPKLLPYSPFRYSPGWINFLGGYSFDQAVSSQLMPGQIFEGFVGQSLLSFRRAKQLGYQELRIQAANSHVNNVMRQHQKAIQCFEIETSWLNEAQQGRTLKEYEMADYIYIHSEYSRQTMLSEGIPEDKLRRIELKVNPRYTPLSAGRKECDKFRIVYVGSLTVMKGVPLLMEAFSRLPNKNAELTLVGGWATRGMRRYLQHWLAVDSRIKVSPGDPLPHLQRANVCIHPSYEDGFAYAPMEALACGTPVIVTEDTGMREYVCEGVNGYVVPTGSWEPILERLENLTLNSLSGG